MSQIKANDLTNTTGGIPTVKSQQLIPTAWVNFNGTGTVAIRDSEGVSSITDNGSGNFQINYLSALANTNYSAVVSNGGSTGSPRSATLIALTVNNCQMYCRNSSLAPEDHDLVTAAIMGGQA
jgi:hypothetical protein